MSNNKFTVAISTRSGGANLVKTAESIAASTRVSDFRFIVVADTLPIRKKHLTRLREMGVEVHEYKQPRSLSAKLKEIVEMTTTEMLIFTQDDLRFKKDALSHIVEKFSKDKKLTFCVSKVEPVPAETFLEKILEVGVKGAYRIGEMFNDGDNYLVANGRCMAFRTKHLKKMNIRENITNLDAYLYFENKKTGGKFKFVEEAIIYNKNPEALSEHVNQSSRFQYSKDELEKYYGDLSEEYDIPLSVYVKAGLSEFITNPLYTILYGALFVYTRLGHKDSSNVIKPLWKADLSTKRVK